MFCRGRLAGDERLRPAMMSFDVNTLRAFSTINCSGILTATTLSALDIFYKASTPLKPPWSL